MRQTTVEGDYRILFFARNGVGGAVAGLEVGLLAWRIFIACVDGAEGLSSSHPGGFFPRGLYRAPGAGQPELRKRKPVATDLNAVYGCAALKDLHFAPINAEECALDSGPRRPNNPTVRGEGKERKTLLGTTITRNGVYRESVTLPPAAAPE
jgi:hypothetical protein